MQSVAADSSPLVLFIMSDHGWLTFVSVELTAVGHAMSPIIVDTSPPVAGTVYDGAFSKHDLAFSKDQLQV